MGQNKPGGIGKVVDVPEARPTAIFEFLPSPHGLKKYCSKSTVYDNVYLFGNLDEMGHANELTLKGHYGVNPQQPDEHTSWQEPSSNLPRFSNLL